MRAVFLLLMVGLCLSPLQGRAAGQCYQMSEAEAEQGIRIQSELMVIGLNCQHMGMRAGKNLYGMYRQFALDHADLFAGYEQKLLTFFKASGDANPVDSLNSLRTKYANEISQDVASMRPDVFCSRYAPRIVTAAAMTQNDLQQWAQTFYEGYPVTYPLCSAADIAMK